MGCVCVSKRRKGELYSWQAVTHLKIGNFRISTLLNCAMIKIAITFYLFTHI